MSYPCRNNTSTTVTAEFYSGKEDCSYITLVKRVETGGGKINAQVLKVHVPVLWKAHKMREHLSGILRIELQLTNVTPHYFVSVLEWCYKVSMESVTYRRRHGIV